MTVGPDLTYNGAWDAFVAKLSADGTSLIYAGYIGGNDEDRGNAIAIDSTGHAYIVGMTYSGQATFPDKTGPDLSYNGVWDAFVAKVEADGSGLVYAGYIGGESDDIGTGIAVDTTGNAYISGYTESTETTFPETVGPDLTSNGNVDAFVAKVKADGSDLQYCGFIGGDNADRGNGIALDTDNNAYIAGEAVSTQATFPVAIGPDLTHNGGDDAFIAKVKTDGTSLLFSGFIGGNSSDWSNGIALDTTGNAYITGYTNSNESTFPVSGGPDLTYNGNSDAFVAKVKADGTSLEYAGYIGGSSGESGYGIAVDGVGNAYITGYTNSNETTFPVTGGPDLSYNGGTDAFVVKVSNFNIYLPAVLR